MILWRLSGQRHARAFDGGYGLLYDGRWNTAGHAVTYCSTSPSLSVLEKLVHVQDPDLLPALIMVRYEVPAGLGIDTIEPPELSGDWRSQEGRTQVMGDRWHDALRTPLLRVPSSILPIDASPCMNVLINHLHPDAKRISILAADPFAFDVRLL